MLIPVRIACRDILLHNAVDSLRRLAPLCPLHRTAQVLAANRGWTGVTSTCTAGSTAQSWRDAAVARVNLYREMCGLDNVTEDGTMSASNMQGALMISANGQLTHFFPPTATCHTTEGDLSNQQSNIAIGSIGAAAVDAFIDDDGANNAVVGHRRWKLYPHLAVIGVGDTGAASSGACCGVDSHGNNIMVLGNGRANGVSSLDGGRSRTEPSFIAWPPAGFCPASLLPGSRRWSLTRVASTDFSVATVTINGVAATVTARVNNDGFTSTIVFTGPNPNEFQGTDIDYAVVVTVPGTGVFSYTVTAFDGLTPDSPTFPAIQVGYPCAARVTSIVLAFFLKELCESFLYL